MKFFSLQGFPSLFESFGSEFREPCNSRTLCCSLERLLISLPMLAGCDNPLICCLLLSNFILLVAHRRTNGRQLYRCYAYSLQRENKKFVLGKAVFSPFFHFLLVLFPPSPFCPSNPMVLGRVISPYAHPSESRAKTLPKMQCWCIWSQRWLRCGPIF